MSRSLLSRPRRGGSFNPTNHWRLHEPPRPLRQRRLRCIFITVASTPPFPRRGIHSSTRLALCYFVSVRSFVAFCAGFPVADGGGGDGTRGAGDSGTFGIRT